jgi:hypothetical protein
MKAGMYVLTTLIGLILYIVVLVTVAVYSEVIALLFIIQTFLVFLIHYILNSEKKHI